MKIHVSNACEFSFSLSFYRGSWPSRCRPKCGANCPYKCPFFGAEKVPLGPIFVLLDPSRQFVGDLERAQDGPQIVPKWSQERFAERKGGSSICSKILRVLAPRRRPKRSQDRYEEASGRHRSAVKLSKISSLPRSIQLLKMMQKSTPKMTKKWSQNGPQMGPKIGSKTGPDTRSILEPSWGRLEAVLGPFLDHFLKKKCKT